MSISIRKPNTGKMLINMCNSKSLSTQHTQLFEFILITWGFCLACHPVPHFPTPLSINIDLLIYVLKSLL